MARRIPYPVNEKMTGEQAARYIQTEVIRVSDPDLSYFLTLSNICFSHNFIITKFSRQKKSIEGYNFVKVTKKEKKSVVKVTKK